MMENSNSGFCLLAEKMKERNMREEIFGFFPFLVWKRYRVPIGPSCLSVFVFVFSFLFFYLVKFHIGYKFSDKWVVGTGSTQIRMVSQILKLVIFMLD